MTKHLGHHYQKRSPSEEKINQIVLLVGGWDSYSTQSSKIIEEIQAILEDEIAAEWRRVESTG